MHNYGAQEYHPTNLKWESFLRILKQTYVPADWDKKNRIDGYGNFIVVRTTPKNQKKVDQLLITMWKDDRSQ